MLFRYLIVTSLLFFGTKGLAWTQGGIPMYRGHEELTLQALKYFPRIGNSVVSGELANISSHPVILGNFAADFPEKAFSIWKQLYEESLRDVYLRSEILAAGSEAIAEATETMNIDINYASLRKRAAAVGVPEDADWHNAAGYQHLHFLRSIEDIGDAGRKNTCLRSKELIKNLTRRTELYNYEGGNNNQTDALPPALRKYYFHLFQFDIGVALHIIQDSFSPAHVRREGLGLREIKDICVYNHIQTSPDGIQTCQHTENDERDVIWRSGPNISIPFGTGADLFPYLKPEAVAAVDASVAYLEVVDTLISYRKELLDGYPSEPSFAGLSPEDEATARLAHMQVTLSYAAAIISKFANKLSHELDKYFHEPSGPGKGMFICL